MPFILTFIAGFSTFVGSLTILFKKNSKFLLSLALSFSATIMIGISLFDLIKESFHFINEVVFLKVIYILIFVNIGIIIGFLFNKKIVIDNKLYKVGVISLLGVILHNIPEGIATYMATVTDINLGISLTTIIAMHNIPEGIIIAMPIYYATNNKQLVFLYTFVASLAEPLGALITFLFLEQFITNNILGYLFSFIAGLMLYIAFYEVIPVVIANRQKKSIKIGILAGIVFLFLI